MDILCQLSIVVVYYYFILTKIQSTMRSFFIALFFLLMVSYWAHIFVSREVPTHEIATVVIDNGVNNGGICECRCCVLSGTMCETTIRYSISFKNDFTCSSCTSEFCIMNVNETEQCDWMHAMRADCHLYEPRRKSSSSFVNVRPILQ